MKKIMKNCKINTSLPSPWGGVRGWGFLLVLLLLSMGLHAQTARQILDNAAAKVSNKGGASASFTMKQGNTTTSGTVQIKGNKFHATATGAELWFDGTTQWAYMTSTQEVNITTPTEAQQQQMNPYKFISLYRTGYNMTKKNVSGGYEIHLVAQNQRRTVQELYVTVSKAYVLKSIRMKSGRNWTSITVSNFRTQSLSDATFRFNASKYPRAEVIDLR